MSAGEGASSARALPLPDPGRGFEDVVASRRAGPLPEPPFQDLGLDVHQEEIVAVLLQPAFPAGAAAVRPGERRPAAPDRVGALDRDVQADLPPDRPPCRPGQEPGRGQESRRTLQETLFHLFPYPKRDTDILARKPALDKRLPGAYVI